MKSLLILLFVLLVKCNSLFSQEKLNNIVSMERVQKIFKNQFVENLSNYTFSLENVCVYKDAYLIKEVDAEGYIEVYKLEKNSKNIEILRVLGPRSPHCTINKDGKSYCTPGGCNCSICCIGDSSGWGNHSHLRQLNGKKIEIVGYIFTE